MVLHSIIKDSFYYTKAWSNHLGLWSIEPMHAISLYNAWRNKSLISDGGELIKQEINSLQHSPIVSDSGITVISIDGRMTKRGSSFGGASTTLIRREVDIAARSEQVKGVLIQGYSPGGHVDGVHDLSEAIRKAAQVKPVFTSISDLGASAFIWAVAYSTRISMNATGMAGSIGTMAILIDDSVNLENNGIKMHVISTAPEKLIGLPGIAITDEMLTSVRSQVETIDSFFKLAVKRGRKLTVNQMKTIETGKMFIGSQAVDVGLVDTIESEEETIVQLEKRIRDNAKINKMRNIN